MKEVSFPRNTKYLGCDIVPEMITSLQSKYANTNREFKVLDIVNDSIPHADIWLCRDVLFHLSNEDVFLTLQNFINSDIPWLLTSTHSNSENNKDIISGSFRLLNLEYPPFNLPKAEKYIEDYVSGFPVRYLGLWHRDTLKQWLEINKR